VSKNEGIEYCNVDLRFDRRTIHTFIKSFIQEGYAMYWSESETQLVASVRVGVKMIKLKFYRIGDRFKLVGNYTFTDEKLACLMEKMIGTTRGHAVVKRTRDKCVVIQNIMFGEVIRSVEMVGSKTEVIEHVHAPMSIGHAFYCDRAERRIAQWRTDVDEQLDALHIAMQEADEDGIQSAKKKLAALRQEGLILEI
jgi:hypothetical protein